MNDALIVSGGFVEVLCSLLKKKYESLISSGFADPLLAMSYLGTDSNIPSLVFERDLKYIASGVGLVGSTEHRLGVIKKNIHWGFSSLQ